jgi:4-hydroxy-tetrahydrodipicolinate synthase
MQDTASVELQGVVPILPTPFLADETIDLAALDREVRFAAEAGFRAACLPAYASEFYKLTEAERDQLVERAIATADGNIAIVAQANHPSARVAAQLARRYETLGASVISFALPRIFPLKEDDLLDYARVICDAVSIGVLIQDFNPGGSTVGADFACRLKEASPNFRYLKLEEPLMGPKIRDIIRATDAQVGVLEGWGGMYLLDLIPAGICGLMPGLGVSDLLQHVWQHASSGDLAEADAVFQVVLPQVSFALQHSELFNWVEKRLLADRGVLPHSSIHVRSATWRPDEATLAHGDRLNASVVRLARELGLAASG